MKLNTLLEYLLTEAKTSKASIEPPEAPKDAPLGQYLFAPVRSDVPSPKEQNTDIENKLAHDLNRHFDGSGDINSIEQSLVTLMDFEKQGLYPKLLKPPSGLAYRFIGNVDPAAASKFFLNGYPIEQITSNPNKAIIVEPVGVVEYPSYVSTVARGKTKIASWTIAPKNTFNTFVATKGGRVALVLVADIASNNFLLNPDNLSKFATANNKELDVSLIKNEKEVISYGPVNVLKASFMYIGASENKNSRSKIMSNLPDLDCINYKKASPKEIFIRQYEYVNDVINTCGSNLNKTQLAKITTDKNYKLLKSAATNGIDMSTPSGLEIIKNILYPGVKGETREPVPMWKIQNAVNDMAYESLHLLLALTINKFNVEQSPVNAGEYTQKALIKALG